MHTNYKGLTCVALLFVFMHSWRIKYLFIVLFLGLGEGLYAQGIWEWVASAKKHMAAQSNDSALHYLNKVMLLRSSQSVSDTALLETYSLMATIYRREGMDYKSLSYLNKVLHIAHGQGDSAEVYKALIRVGISYALSSEYGKGIERFKSTLKYAKRRGDSNLMAATKANIGACLIDSGLVAEGLQFEEAALELRKSLFRTDSVGNYRQLSGLYFNLADAYQMLGQFEKALPLARKSYTIRKNLNWELGLAANAVQFTKYFTSIGDVQRAGSWLDSCKKYMQTLPKKRQTYIQLAADYFKLIREYEKAFDYLKQYRATEDSLDKVFEANKLVFAKIDYEVQEARNQLALLEKENHLSEAKLYSRNLQRIALLLLLLAALAVGMVVIRQLRQKASHAQELAGKNQEVELLLKELQHRVKNNMQAVAGMFELTLERITQEEARAKLIEFKGSLTAMMLIQKRLYSHERMSRVSLSEFLDEFLWTVLEMYGARDRVKLHTHFADFEVSGDFATKFGLICSELLSNSLKHGFDESGGNNSIWLDLQTFNEGFAFIYRDNGVGFNYNEMLAAGSLGLTVVSSLTQELKGVLSFDPETVSFTFKFDKNAYIDS